jgi:hypothetical protein
LDEGDFEGVLSSHVWEPRTDPGGRLAGRARDADVGVQDKTFAQATALVKHAWDRSGNPLPPSVLAHEKLAADIGLLLGLSVNEVFLLRDLGDAWEGHTGEWASLHCLVPEPFQRLEEFPDWNDIWSGADQDTLENDAELRQIRLFDALIMNGDRHPGNVLISGGRVPDRRWA